MSWAGISSNDWVTNNNVQDAVNNGLFTLRGGQSIPSNNNFITTAEAFAKLNINDVGDTGTSWMTKGQFVSSISYYTLTTLYSRDDTSETSPNPICARNFSYNPTLYTTNSNGIVNIGDAVYTWEEGYGYVVISTYGTFISYMENSIRVWIYFNLETGLIADKGRCTAYYQASLNGIHIHNQSSGMGNGCAAALDIDLELYTLNSDGSLNYRDGVFVFDGTDYVDVGVHALNLGYVYGIVVSYLDMTGDRWYFLYDYDGELAYDKEHCDALSEFNQITVDSPLGSHEIYIYSQYPVTSDITVQVSVALGGSSSGLYINRWVTIYTGNSNANDYIGGDYSDGNASILDISPSSDATYTYYAF